MRDANEWADELTAIGCNIGELGCTFNPCPKQRVAIAAAIEAARKEARAEAFEEAAEAAAYWFMGGDLAAQMRKKAAEARRSGGDE